MPKTVHAPGSGCFLFTPSERITSFDTLSLRGGERRERKFNR